MGNQEWVKCLVVFIYQLLISMRKTLKFTFSEWILNNSSTHSPPQTLVIKVNKSTEYQIIENLNKLWRIPQHETEDYSRGEQSLAGRVLITHTYYVQKKDTIGKAASRKCITVKGWSLVATSSRWWGASACSSFEAFAVEMLRPLYTWNEREKYRKWNWYLWKC